MQRTLIRIGIWTGVIVLLVGITVLVSNGALGNESVHELHAWLSAIHDEHRLEATVVYFLIYLLVVSLCLPIDFLLTIGSGLLLGFWPGLLVVSFGSAIGSVFGLLLSRHLLRNVIRRRLPNLTARIDRGVRREGLFYLLSLRLIPGIPFTLVNLCAGLTDMRLLGFYIVTQTAMLPRMAIYVWVGSGLASLEAPEDILSPGLIVAFVALGLAPLASRRLVTWLRRRRSNSEAMPVEYSG